MVGLLVRSLEGVHRHIQVIRSSSLASVKSKFQLYVFSRHLFQKKLRCLRKFKYIAETVQAASVTQITEASSSLRIFIGLSLDLVKIVRRDVS